MASAVSGTPSVDGRRARRDRGKTAVVDAMFELLQEGQLPPAVEAIAERAGVSVSSVFRYFENLDDLQQRTIERYFERFASLFTIPAIGQGPLDDRIKRLVDARLDLYEVIGPIALMARARAVDSPRLARTLDQTRSMQAGLVRTHFTPELGFTHPSEGRRPRHAHRLHDLVRGLGPAPHDPPPVPPADPPGVARRVEGVVR